MKKSLFLYLFIISVLINLFTYKFLSDKSLSELKTLKSENKKLNEDVLKFTNQKIENDAFTLINNDRAQNYLNQKDIKAFEEKVKQALLTYNDSREGNIYTGQIKMGNQKFVINNMKILNHRWIIADYSNGELWGEVLLKYFVNDDGSISFELLNTYLYSKDLN